MTEPGAPARPWTPDRREGTSTVLTVKRCCNGCRAQLGDATDAELEAAVAGLPLPDVRGECPTCRNAPAEGGATDAV